MPKRYSSHSTAMAKLSKEERKQLVKTVRAAERTEEIASMPLSPEQLTQLLDYLEGSLKSCDHTTNLTNIFLDDAALDENRVLPWLAQHGGYCDCEVLYNLEDFAESFREQPIPPKPQPKKKQKPRSLNTLTGWNLAKLPQPWRIANLYTPDKPLQIQMGKKGRCKITIVESPMPPGDRSSDNYWSKLWFKRTELPKRSPTQVSHTALDLPNNLSSTLVQAPRWTPVYCWIIPDAQQWHLEVQTESNRQQGDLPQIARLVTLLETNKE